MTGYVYSDVSLKRLEGVHPILVAIVTLALRRYASMDFMVLEGRRKVERQKKLVREGRSQTMDSKHLLQDDGFAHAVDLGPLDNGDIPWNDWSAFEQLADAMHDAADELGYGNILTWGGDWDSFKDGPHFQLEL